MWEAGYKIAFIWLVSFYPWHSYSWDSHVSAKGATKSAEWKGQSELPKDMWNAVCFFQHFKTCSAGFLLHSAASQKQSSVFNLSLNFVCHKKKKALSEWSKAREGRERGGREGNQALYVPEAIKIFIFISLIPATHDILPALIYRVIAGFKQCASCDCIFCKQEHSKDALIWHALWLFIRMFPCLLALNNNNKEECQLLLLKNVPELFYRFAFREGYLQENKTKHICLPLDYDADIKSLLPMSKLSETANKTGLD